MTPRNFKRDENVESNEIVNDPETRAYCTNQLLSLFEGGRELNMCECF